MFYAPGLRVDLTRADNLIIAHGTLVLLCGILLFAGCLRSHDSHLWFHIPFLSWIAACSYGPFVFFYDRWSWLNVLSVVSPDDVFISYAHLSWVYRFGPYGAIHTSMRIYAFEKRSEIRVVIVDFQKKP